MPLELLVMRHAKSSWDDPSLPDHARPLTARGKRDATQMGHDLAQAALVPDLVLTSPAKRARGTCRRVVKSMSYAGEVRPEAWLYESTPVSILKELAKLPGWAKRVLMVGHNPTLADLVRLLCGQTVTLATATVARLSFAADAWDEAAAPQAGRLLAVLQPSGTREEGA